MLRPYDAGGGQTRRGGGRPAGSRYFKDPSLMAEAARWSAGYPGGHAEGFPDTFKQLVRQVYQAIESGPSAAPAIYPTLLNGHRIHLLSEAIRNSLRSERWAEVALPPMGG